METVFVDSSVLFSAVNSPIGGSAKLFTTKRVTLITSRVVLTETERNIREKLQRYHLERFFMLVGKMTINRQLPNKKLDAVILAEAKRAKTRFLVTLDRKHFLTPAVGKFIQPQRAVTPKVFFEHGENQPE